MPLPSLTKPLATLLLLLGISQPVWADDNSYDAEGERRAKSAGSALIGQPAPAVKLTTLDGKQLDLTELYGKKPVYLKFWATWCVPCRQQMPGFEAIEQKFGDQIQVIAVNTGFSDDADAIRAYRKELGLTMPIAIDDGTLATALNLRVTPQHVVIGRDGKIMHVGHLEDQALHTALQQAISEESQPIARATSASTAPTFAVGDKVSGLGITTLGGRKLDLGAANQKPRAIVFFAPWCESYLAESRPQTAKNCQFVREEAEKLMANEKGVEWLGVSSGLWVSVADLQDYRKSAGSTLPLALNEDDSLFRAFGVRDIPSVVLLDSQGRIARILSPQDRDLADAIKGLK
ncbi:TlpA family protein disulfide reductase [Aeromonas sp. NJAU223]|uniref:TlpA family protein disulfide reductase n=1 Tax=Aeromonas sp. NJAU223 TaxID=3115650 RepID=UPI003DAA3F42